MTKLYKLTDATYQTHKGCQWGENVTHTASGKGELCSSAWLHAYTHPVLALLLNPIHADIPNPVLWKCRGVVGITDHGLKVGCTSLTTLRRLPLPTITSVHRMAFAIGCAFNVYQDPAWVNWARDWVLHKDRSVAAADAAAVYAGRAADAARAARAAAYDAARAAYAAAARAAAAYAAAHAAAAATDIADTAVYAATAAVYAARAAARAADDAARAAIVARAAAAIVARAARAAAADLPLHALAEWAMTIE